MNAVAPICNDKECKVQVDGNCRLKRDPVESCPNYAPEKEVVDEAVVVAEEEPRTAPPVRIWPSEKMLLADLAVFVRGRRVRNVALVGEEKVGKTTLLVRSTACTARAPSPT